MPESIKIIKALTFFSISPNAFILSGTSDGHLQLSFADDYVETDVMNVDITQVPGEAQKVGFSFPDSYHARMLHGRVKLTIAGAKQLVEQLQVNIGLVEAAVKSVTGQ